MKRTPFNAKPKPRKCKACRGPMPPDARASATACGVECAALLGAEASAKEARRKAKIQRANDAAKREAQKTLPQLKAALQKAFNEFIRLRDHDQECISCGGRHRRHKDTSRLGGMYDAGHYRSVGSADHLRFVEINCHKQCKYCNDYLKGNVVNYRIRLKRKIGIGALEALENDNAIFKYTRDWLIEKTAEYRQKIKELKNERAKKNGAHKTL